MKTKYFFLAAFAAMLASCANEEYIGDTSPNAALEQTGDGSIQFGFDMQNMTRGDIVGSGAATLLGNNFYVTGTKGTEGTDNPSETLVFDNYLVHYGINTAGTTESNTANWEYVGITPGSGAYTNWAKLATTATTQTIKYWDYSTDQYDFLAFSTGNKKAVKKTAFTGEGALVAGEIGVTEMKYGTGLNGSTAYTFYIPELEGLQNSYITDITPVAKTNYGKEVQLQFKNLGSKIRIALYETVPGYSIKAASVKFYTEDAGVSPTDLGSGSTTTAALISPDATYGFVEKGTIAVSFPQIGTNADGNGNKYKASVTVSPVAAALPRLYQTFGTLDNKQPAQGSEDPGTLYLGRSLTEATYAGNSAVGYYQVVFPVSTSYPLTLRVDYQLISTDGSGETINVYGAKAVVPATYTVWQPNYAYTYVFKISDNTNGWTDTDHTKAGLFPITFDAVVAEVKDASGEQTTITTVAMPSITTYQQGHDKAKDEYSIATGKNIYVQVMDNEDTTNPSLVGVSPSTKPLLNVNDPYIASKLYDVTSSTGTPISEATVMDALQNRTTAISSKDDGDLTGRNGITLTKSGTISNTVTSIVNGADDKAITVTAGQAAEITIGSLTADHTYAYVYDYGNAPKTETNIYQPKSFESSYVILSTEKYVTEAIIDGGTTTSAEAVDYNYLYFSKTTTDGTNYTYSYYSVDGKENVPAGLKKVAVGSLLPGDGSATAEAKSAKFVFDVYIRNTGKYAVKVIKVVD